jgi:hypothetical protein
MRGREDAGRHILFMQQHDSHTRSRILGRWRQMPWSGQTIVLGRDEKRRREPMVSPAMESRSGKLRQ